MNVEAKNRIKESQQMRDLLLTALAPIVWGSTYFVTTQFLPANQPFLVGALRALPIGLVILLFYRRLPQGKWWLRISLLGAFNVGIFFAFLFVAAYRLPGGVAATMGAIQPFLVALLAWIGLNDRPAWRTLGLGLLSVIGVAMLVLGPAAKLDMLGMLAAFAGTLCAAIGIVLTKRWGRPPEASLLLFTGWQLVVGGIILMPLALLLEGLPATFTLPNWLGFIYLGLVNTGLAYLVWFRGLERRSVSQTSFLMLLNPVSAVLLGWLLLGQALTIVQLSGLATILFSVFLAQKANSARAAKSTLPATPSILTVKPGSSS